MNLRYIDTHSHLHFRQYYDDPTTPEGLRRAGREEVIARMREEGVATIAIGTDLETSKQAIALVEKYPDVVLGATVGVHPNDTDEEFSGETFTKILNDKVVGVGECGLDYFRQDASDEGERKRQEANFRVQIEFALEHNLPLMLHIRDAHEDALRILESYGQRGKTSPLRGTCHFFTGLAEVALKYVELGLYISFPGVITFAKETHDAVIAVPLERILSETDAPYAAPVPYRGERNEPAYVVEVAKKIAEIKQCDGEVVREQLVQNALELFAIRARL